MKKAIQIAPWTAVLTLLALTALPCLAADSAVLRNGFSIRHERRQVIGTITRLYTGTDDSSFVDIPTTEIDHFEAAPPEATPSEPGLDSTKGSPAPQSGSQQPKLQASAESLQHPLDLNEVVRIVRSETSLCYRLLRLANSPLWGIRNDITSVRDAFILVGEDRFRALASVAAACVLGEGQPTALTSLSVERARFCELLAPLIGANSTEQFLIGLLSLLDTVLQTPMESIVQSLPLREEAKAALLGAANLAAVPLCLIRSFESGAWGKCASAADAVGVSEETLARLYIESVQWARDTVALSR